MCPSTRSCDRCWTSSWRTDALTRSLPVLLLSLLLLFVPSYPAQAQTIVPSVEPGVYGSDLVLTFGFPAVGGELEYRFLHGESSPYVPYTFPLHLTALEGEERRYRIGVRGLMDGTIGAEATFDYVIDKRLPAPPDVTVPPGSYEGQISVELQAPPDATTYYALAGETREWRRWTGEAIAVSPEADHAVERTLLAYAADEAGNQTATRAWTYTVVPPPREQPRLLSPVAGTFANRQLLYVTRLGGRDVFYTADGTDPASDGIRYTGPVVVEAAGEVSLRLYAPATGSVPEFRREVVYTVAPGSTDPCSCPQGVHTGSVAVQFTDVPGEIHFTFTDEAPTLASPRYRGQVSISPPPGALRVVPFRYRVLDPSGAWSAEYRRVFVLEDRQPAAPQIVLGGSLPARQPVPVSFRAAPNASVYYTLDGSPPTRESRRYRSAFTVTPPEAAGSSSVSLRARAFYQTGLRSDEATARLDFDLEAPAAPRLRVRSTPFEAEVLFDMDSEGADVVYEVGSAEAADPSLQSPVAQGPILLRLPVGTEGTFRLKAAARDAAGNLSSVAATGPIILDRLPPPPPLLRREDRTIVIEGSGTIYYGMTTDGSQPEVAVEDASRYEGPIGLPADRDGEYRVAAVAVDQAGNVSELAGPTTFVVAENRPTTPTYSGVDDGGLYARREVTLAIDYPARESVHVYYTVAEDGAEPPNPDAASERAGQTVVFRGTTGEETGFWVKLVTVDTVSGAVGAVTDLRFTIDLDPPDLPVVRGAEPEGVYNRPVTVDATPVDPGDAVSIRYGPTPEDVDPTAMGTSAGASLPITFDTPKGTERSIHFRITATDAAGNVTVDQTVYHVVIDKAPPAPPAAQGIPESRRSSEPVTVTFPESADAVFYELRSGGAVPQVLAGSSPVYAAPVVLDGRNGEEVQYALAARSVDAAGNTSPVVRYTVLVDRKPPAGPSSPAVEPAGDGRSVVLSWVRSKDAALMYRVRPSVTEENLPFQEYTAPVIARTSSPGETIVCEYYRVDNVGNETQVSRVELPAVAAAVSPSLAGIEDGGLYAEACTVSNATENALVRYELGTTVLPPGPVTRYSPVLPESLTLNAASGETVRYVLRARSFDGLAGTPISSEVEYTVTLDKTPPPAPTIRGIDDNGYYQEDIPISFVAPGARTIYYNVQKDSGAAASVADGEFTRYEEPFRLSPTAGALHSYTITAYSVDDAGNRSVATPHWRVFIDKEILYVAENGNDFFDGSRSRPLQTIRAALELSEATGKKTIFLSGGTYDIHEPVLLNRDVTIVGGFRPDNWQDQRESTSVLATGQYFPNGATVLAVGGGTTILRNITVQDPRQRAERIFAVYQGQLQVEQVSISVDSPTVRQLVAQEGGRLEIEGSSFESTAAGVTSLLVLSGGTTTLSRSRFYRRGSGGEMRGIMITGQRGTVLYDCEIGVGTGERTVGLGVEDSTVSLEGVTVRSGIGVRRATALEAQDSRLTLQNVSLATEADSRLSIGMSAERCEIDMERSTVSSRAALGATAVYARESRLRLVSSTVTVGSTSEFQYLTRLTGASGLIANCQFRGGTSRDYIGVSMDSSPVRWINNSMLHGSGVATTRGFQISGDGLPVLVNNVVARESPARRGVAVRWESALRAPTIMANSFDGWDVLFVQVDPASREIARQAPGPSALNLLDGEALGGNLAQNIAEPLEQTFQTRTGPIWRIREGSACVDGGVDATRYGGPAEDAEGQARPNPAHGVRPRYDIGADEYYDDGS